MTTNNGCYSGTCPFSLTRNVHSDKNIPSKKIIHVLDNELRLRSITNSPFLINFQNNVGRFDELTHFFNLIHGLFHQSPVTLGLSTYRLSPLFRLSELNVGFNMHLDQNNFLPPKIDLFRNLTLFGLIGNTDRRSNTPLGIIKFHTSEKNLMFGINHRWTPSLKTIFRVGTAPQKRFWSHIEYQRPTETYELIGRYGEPNSSSIQFSYLSSLWERKNSKIDGGIDLQITTKENFADMAFRWKHFSNSIVFKFDIYHPFEHYLIALQRYITSNFTVGFLLEKMTNQSSRQQAVKFSLMSQWDLNRTGSRINTLLNTQNECGLALTQQMSYVPLVFQLFGLYSWTTSKYKWGVGLQILL